jgi:hypothetical protein
MTSPLRTSPFYVIFFVVSSFFPLVYAIFFVVSTVVTIISFQPFSHSVTCLECLLLECWVTMHEESHIRDLVSIFLFLSLFKKIILYYAITRNDRSHCLGLRCYTLFGYLVSGRIRLIRKI